METDEEQVEKLKKWWQENGRAVITGLVLGVVGLFGYRYWVDQQEATAEAASALDEAFFEKNVAPALPPGSVLTGGDSKLTGAEEGRLLSGATVALGGIEIEDTPLALLDLASIGEVGGPKVAGIVGRDILLRYRLIFDFADSVLILESYAK